MMIGKLMVISIVARSRPTSAAWASSVSSVSRTSSTVPDVFQASARSATVRSVFLRPEPPTRIGRCGWTGRGSHERVVERVGRAVVAEPLPVEQAAHQHHRLVEPVEAPAGGLAERDPERVVLALEPRAADAQDRAAARDVVEGRGELGRVARGCGTCWPRPSGRGGPAVVSGASPARTIQPSKIGCSHGPKIARRWSHVQIESQPASSAARAASRKPGQSVCWDQSWSPNRIVVTVPGCRGQSRWSWTAEARTRKLIRSWRSRTVADLAARPSSGSSAW